MLYASITSDTSYWYDKALGSIQIKQITSKNTTLGVDLSNTAPMTLCQNVSLTVGDTYNLTYGIYSPVYSQNMVAKAYINDILVTQVGISPPDTFSWKSYVFTATLSSNFICFN